MTGNDWILVGMAGAAHGVKGEQRLKSYTAEPMALASFPALWVGDPPSQRVRLATARLLKDDMLVVRFAGVEGREAAQALTNTALYVARADLPPPDEDEFYHVDLIGLAVQGPDGSPVGTVVALENFGAGDMLEIRPPEGQSAYLPFTRAFAPVVDLEARRIELSADAMAALVDPGEPEGGGT